VWKQRRSIPVFDFTFGLCVKWSVTHFSLRPLATKGNRGNEGKRADERICNGRNVLHVWISFASCIQAMLEKPRDGCTYFELRLVLAASGPLP
jgi:hypothetical protein